MVGCSCCERLDASGALAADLCVMSRHASGSVSFTTHHSPFHDLSCPVTSWHMCGTLQHWFGVGLCSWIFVGLPGQGHNHEGRIAMAGSRATCAGRCTTAVDSSDAVGGRVPACIYPCPVIACSPPLFQAGSSSSSSSAPGSGF